MSLIGYLYRTAFKNKLKKALKKPVTYIYFVLVGIYLVSFFVSLPGLVEKLNMANPEGLIIVLSFTAILFLPLNFMSYAKRKGLVFKQSDVQFLFTMPVHPKLVLLYAHLRTIIMGLVLAAFLVPAGVIMFHVPIWKMLLYFIGATVVENVLEGSIMLLLYGNERFSEKTVKVFGHLLMAFLFAMMAYIIYLFLQDKNALRFIHTLVENRVFQAIPVIGWSISFYRLLLLGPTTLNVICTALYFLTTIVFLVMAVKMKCTGLFYEDAMKFADDYEEALKKTRRGEMALVGKRKRFGRASITYKGSGAKAIYYKQILEYKKNRTFIFGWNTLISLAVGIVGVFLFRDEDVKNMGMFVLPGVSAYICFIFSGYSGKWGKEIVNPYTFLIPDSTVKKLWYATLVEHYRSIVDGLLISIPIGVVLRLTPLQIVLGLFIYVCLQANKLYVLVLAEALIGNTLGQFGKQLFKMIFQGIAIGIGAIGAFLGTLLWNLEFGYFIMIVICGLITLAEFYGASTLFYRMENNS
ncbi:putative ABC exporter domain-containing protein [Anaeromicropila populeti]|uniref:Putative ABC exporter n=1 Tax=Anaeromicropila populeti TaxID=37658 RepID=A0A1I6LIU5_9FIRM|nr:putative ABC exporter domain-containing protein [Anaeromicropila populeti]SFS03250.1 Putative ABC exporter [Anaeromicropila populeti]